MGWIEEFISETIEDIRRRVDGKAIAAVSGGVDSTTAAVLAKMALGKNLVPVFIDTGYMRVGEGEHVRSKLSKLLDIKLYNYSEEFYKRTFNIQDAETKRRRFREAFYHTLSEIARKENCKWVVQGTIAPDWIETVSGIKTQHNVLEDIGLNPLKKYGFRVVEPLRRLYKNEVKKVAKTLGIPESIVKRQPFPGPGLLVRILGRANREKVRIIREATKIVEDSLGKLGYAQYFPAIAPHPEEVVEDRELGVTLEDFPIKATGVRDNVRVYAPLKGVSEGIGIATRKWREILRKYRVSRVLAKVRSGEGKYSIFLRGVVTKDFMTAKVKIPPLNLLENVAIKLQEIGDVGPIYWDVTPKPPATIEYE